MNYQFRFKRKFVYTTRTVMGHRYDQSLDKMVMYFPDGGVEEVPNWKHCGLKLGPDWAESQRLYAEEQKAKAVAEGQATPING